MLELMTDSSSSINDSELLLNLYGLMKQFHEKQQEMLIEIKLLRESIENQRTRLSSMEERCARRPSICGSKTPFPRLVSGDKHE